MRHPGLRPLLTALLCIAASAASAQTTTEFHLHDEDSGDPCCRALKTTGPDVTSSVIDQSGDLKTHGTEHVAMRLFKTLAAAPNWYGSIASGSTIRFTLWMKKTSGWGEVYPEARLRLNDWFGTLFCTATGVPSATLPNKPANQALTTTLAEYVFSCTTSAAVTVTTTDRLWVEAGYYLATGPGNHSMKVELHIEGSSSSPVPDSRVVVPNPVAPTPTITSLDYATAPPNTIVHIAGTNFADSNVTRSVKFGTTVATTVTWAGNGTEADATVPSNLAPGPSPEPVSAPITVTVYGVASSPHAFSVNPPPTLTSLTPSTAHTTDVVTIVGQNFLGTQAQGSSTVKFNNITASPSSWSETSIQVPVPAGQTTGNVVVTVANRSTSPSLPFTLIPPPSITALYPTSGQVGTSVTIVGERLGGTQGTNTIQFNGVATTPTQWSDTVIKAPVPVGAGTGPVVVTVSNQPNPSPQPTFTVLVPGTMGGSITRVTGGTAISGASVQAVLAGVVKGTATSAADGTYSIAGLDPGSYDVRVFKTGFSPELRTGQTVTATNNTTVNVTMYMPGSATGRVTQVDGVTPLVGAAVTAYDGPMQKGTTNTNGTGDYTIANLHPGSFTVQAANVGYRTQEQTAIVAENAATTTNFSLSGAPAGPVLYAYDELGRLVQVTDPSGDSAIYRYDPVGNITAIERPGAATIAISDFTPNSGPETATVTLSGSGFSPTPSLNLVKFNGTSATVTSATATQIVTTVPAGATDGSITVEVGTVTGTSVTPFDVSALSMPTVTSFSPLVAAPGTALTVTGTNFDTVPINDTVRVNLSPALVGSATSTAIQTSVPPSAMTGRVSVATPNGAAVSTDYLWVPPPLYAVADFGETVVVSFGLHNVTAAATKISVQAFEGIEGHRVATAITADGNALSSVSVKLYGPFGAVLRSAIVQTGGFLDTITLRWTGTYSLVFDPVTGDAHAGTLTIYDVPADVSGSIAFGTAFPVTTTVPGQNARLTFTGTAGHRLSLDQTSASCFTSSVSILAPDGTTVVSDCGGFVGPSGALPVDGTYTVLVDPKEANTVSTSVTLYDVPADATGTLTVNDPAVPVSLQTPGQNARYTFAGSNAQPVTVQLTDNTIAGTFPCLTVSLLRPDGSGGFTPLTQNSGCGSFTLSTQTLPATDTYTVTIDPVGNSVGTVKVRVASP